MRPSGSSIRRREEMESSFVWDLVRSWRGGLLGECLGDCFGGDGEGDGEGILVAGSPHGSRLRGGVE